MWLLPKHSKQSRAWCRLLVWQYIVYVKLKTHDSDWDGLFLAVVQSGRKGNCFVQRTALACRFLLHCSWAARYVWKARLGLTKWNLTFLNLYLLTLFEMYSSFDAVIMYFWWGISANYCVKTTKLSHVFFLQLKTVFFRDMNRNAYNSRDIRNHRVTAAFPSCLLPGVNRSNVFPTAKQLNIHPVICSAFVHYLVLKLQLWHLSHDNIETLCEHKILKLFHSTNDKSSPALKRLRLTSITD